MAVYEEVMAGGTGDRADVLVAISGDLGSHGHVAEIIELIAPRYDADRHGEKKIRVIPWTVNDKEDMKRLKNWGIDGFITDYPNRAAELGFSLKMNTVRK